MSVGEGGCTPKQWEPGQKVNINGMTKRNMNCLKNKIENYFCTHREVKVLQEINLPHLK